MQIFHEKKRRPERWRGKVLFFVGNSIMHSSLLNQIKTAFNVHKVYLTQFAIIFPCLKIIWSEIDDDT